MRSPDVATSSQGGFGPNLWSGDRQLFVQCRKPGDFVELKLPVKDQRPHKITIYATRSWDYGMVRFSVNGQRAGEDVDLFNAKSHEVSATGPIALGVFDPKSGQFVIRAEVVGGNVRSEGTKSYFGLDCIVLEAQ